MKMTPALCRVVSVWLCVAVVCWYCSCYVGSTKSQQDAQRTVSSQDVGAEEEESGEAIHHHKVEEKWVSPTQSPPENERLIEEDHQREEQAAQGVDSKSHAEASEVEAAAAEVEPEADGRTSQPQTEHRQASDHQHPANSITEEQDSASLPPSPDPLPGSEIKDSLSLLNSQDDVPESASDATAEVAPPEVTDPSLHPAECEEDEDNLYDDSPPTVLENTSNVHTAGTNAHSEPPLGPPAGHGSQHLEANASHMLKEQDHTDSAVSSKYPEDIPTFDEWKRKVMEVEKEKTQSTHTATNGAPHVVKKAQKNFNNYASVECGAKILGANPEAKSTAAILRENMDLYMLNPCSNKIWFIIELCEPIQVKQLDIANFELFSSTPKDFLVSISDRYPTNKWLKLGTFHARDERTVQSFPLDEQLYAKYVKMFTKYIKVELLSHFGSEHFCPLSLIRVFGTSMVEEYEEIDPSERSDDQDDEVDYSGAGEVKLSKNLIGSAKEVILKMVNDIAVNVLGGGDEMQGNLSSQEANKTPPSDQFETSSQTPITDLKPALDSAEEELLPDPDIVEAVDPSLEAPEATVTETSTAESSEQELPPEEERIVIPLANDEEEPITAMITLLDKETDREELNDDEKSGHPTMEQHEGACSLPPLFSSSCSCAVALREHLLRQCSAALSKRRRCQPVDTKQTIPPVWRQSPSPSACPEPPPQHGAEVHPPREKEPASEREPESAARPSEAAPPPGSAAEPVSEPPPLEPSQTVVLPRPGAAAADSSPAKPAPIVETPQLSSEEPAKEPAPEQIQEARDGEKHVEPTPSLTGSVESSEAATADDASVAQRQDKPGADVPQSEISTPVQTSDKTDQSQPLHPTTGPSVEHRPLPPAGPESGAAPPEEAQPAPDVTEPESSGGPTETKMDDFAEDLSASTLAPSPSSPSSATSPSPSDIYADPPNGTEQNGNPVHGSSQKESVFMRLNNRIKALEMNMSLSGRYLEQLSQRYRKQMEEMQKAFNKTIIKLQNTSRIAEEQDQRQTESIQLLQGQLENVTQLVLNLSVRVSQLQAEVSDRQNYLLLSLALCLFLGLLLCVNYCCIAAIPPTTEPERPVAKSYTYCCPERQFTCDEMGLKRSASYPLIHSDSLQLATAEGPETLHAEDTLSLCPANRKRRRRKMKPLEKVETLKPSFHAAPELLNGEAVCNGGPAAAATKRLLQPLFRDSPSEGSSEGSSHSDDPSFCGITAACSRICDGLPPPRTRAEKRALRRRRPKPGCAVVDFLQAPKRDKSHAAPVSTIHDIVSRKTEQSSGTFGVNVALSGPV